MRTDTANLMRHGLALSQVSWEIFKRRFEWTNETPDHIITHQVSSTHQKKVLEALHLDPKKSFSNIGQLGNTGSAAVPLSLVMKMRLKLSKKMKR